MALNGVIYGNTSGIRVKAKLEWSATQDIASNSSTITAKLYYYKENYGSTPTGGSWKGSITIDGEQFSGSSGTVSLKPGGAAVLVYTAEKVVYHNADGSKTLSISASGALPPSSVTSTDLSGTVTLDSIPRQAVISYAPNFNDEEDLTISYSNPAGNAVESLQVCINLGTGADITYRDVPKTGSSYTFHFSEAERTILRQKCTDSVSKEVLVILNSVIGGVSYWSDAAVTLTIVNAEPTVSPTLEDTNAKTVALTGDPNKCVRYQSHIRAVMNPQPKKFAGYAGSTITNGNVDKYAFDATFENAMSGDFRFVFRDSRNLIAQKTISMELVPYVEVTCNLNTRVTLADDNTTTVTLRVQGSYFGGSFGKVGNTLRVCYRYKEQGGSYSGWTEGFSISIDGASALYTAAIDQTGLDYTKTYVFQAMVQDKLGSKTTPEIVVATKPVFYWNDRNFYCNVPMSCMGNPLAYFPIGYIYMSMSDTSPAQLFGGSWEKIENTFLWAAGSSATVGQTGGEYTHTLTVDEMPKHNHGINFSTEVGPYASPPLGQGGQEWGYSENTVSATGGGKAHNNMPPYLAVNMWRRVA